MDSNTVQMNYSSNRITQNSYFTATNLPARSSKEMHIIILRAKEYTIKQWDRYYRAKHQKIILMCAKYYPE